MTRKDVRQDEPKGIFFAKSTLRALDLSEKIVGQVLKKLQFEVNAQEIGDIELVYDFILRELSSVIKTEMPLFSKAEEEQVTITALVSENSSGQSCMATKLGVLQQNATVIRFREDGAFTSNTLAESMFNIEYKNTTTLAELMGEIRKTVAQERNIILDLKMSFREENESKKFIETIRRSYSNVEFILNISAIQSENYNRKILSKYHGEVEGVIINYLDQCLSFGSIINLHHEFNNVPLKFFGTGAVVPDDIESATAERILVQMFDL